MYPFIETIRIEDGQIYNLDYHTERFNRTRAVFWKNSVPLDLREYISPPVLNGIHKCRIVYGKDGYLTDTSIANIALYDGHTWFTPAHPLLRGTKRAELLNKQFIVEKDIAQVHLNDYSHIMLFNAMIDWERIVLPINEKHLIL